MLLFPAMKPDITKKAADSEPDKQSPATSSWLWRAPSLTSKAPPPPADCDGLRCPVLTIYLMCCRVHSYDAFDVTLKTCLKRNLLRNMFTQICPLAVIMSPSRRNVNQNWNVSFFSVCTQKFKNVFIYYFQINPY